MNAQSDCIPYDGGRSVLLAQYYRERAFNSGYFNSSNCEQRHINVDKLGLNWWISEDGSFINIQTNTETLEVEHYCIDDFIDKNDQVTAISIVCEEELDHLLNVETKGSFASHSIQGNLGTCCPQSNKEGFVYAFTPMENELGPCNLVAYNQSLKEHPFLTEANYSKEYFLDFPTCDSERAFHQYLFTPGPFDTVRIGSDRIAYVQFSSGQCVTHEVSVKVPMCVNYVRDDQTGDLQPAAFACGEASIIPVFVEKFILTTVLFSISTICLFITLIYLFTVRVRRGMVTVRKVKLLIY